MTVRIAMWSGPRNISTAMMRAFENRPDAAVSDEPFYAAYLAETGLDHPMRDEVLASQPTDWRTVAKAMAGPAPGGATVWYQKHMTHHMLPDFGMDWAGACRSAFLIRAPEAVLASYTVKREQVTLDDIGFVQQRDLFERDRAAFVKTWSRKDGQIRRRIEAGRARLDSVDLPVELIELSARLCMSLGTDGLRGELTLIRAARALASIEECTVVTPAHLRRIAPSVLRHRLRRDPLDESGSGARVERAMLEVLGA